MANVTKEDLRQTGLWIGVLNTPFVGAVCSSRVTATSTVTSSKMVLKGESTGDGLPGQKDLVPIMLRSRETSTGKGQKACTSIKTPLSRIYIQIASL